MMALSQIKQTVRSTTASYVQKLQAVELLYRLGHTKHWLSSDIAHNCNILWPQLQEVGRVTRGF